MRKKIAHYSDPELGRLAQAIGAYKIEGDCEPTALDETSYDMQLPDSTLPARVCDSPAKQAEGAFTCLAHFIVGPNRFPIVVTHNTGCGVSCKASRKNTARLSDAVACHLAPFQYRQKKLYAFTEELAKRTLAANPELVKRIEELKEHAQSVNLIGMNPPEKVRRRVLARDKYLAAQKGLSDAVELSANQMSTMREKQSSIDGKLGLLNAKLDRLDAKKNDHFLHFDAKLDELKEYLKAIGAMLEERKA